MVSVRSDATFKKPLGMYGVRFSAGLTRSDDGRVPSVGEVPAGVNRTWPPSTVGVNRAWPPSTVGVSETG
jgi:hypothetical protein